KNSRINGRPTKEEIMVRQVRDGIVEFSFFRPYAICVTLVGDFNGWHTKSLPMTKGPDGWWRYRLRLAPGCYQFRYLVDGKWHTDYAAFGLEQGPYGFNSLVKVDPPENKGLHIAKPILYRNRRYYRSNKWKGLSNNGHRSREPSLDSPLKVANFTA
ncbi:MAG: isoamylase early set domain-containing protein, partial [Planctomycetota bacterium]